MAKAYPAFELYPRNRSRGQLDLALFRRPTAEYRGTPFWSWNNRLCIPQLLRQIDQLKQMGFGGFHMHPRTGMETEYLGRDFMDAVVACTKHAKRRGMLPWLYDEDRWPSGFAGGLVTKGKSFRAKRLLWTSKEYRGDGVLLARYGVTLKDGRLAKYRRLAASAKHKVSDNRWSA